MSRSQPAQRQQQLAAHLGPVMDDVARREQFGAHELAIVLSHYDLGVIEQIRSYARGSRRAPKVRIRSNQGHFLLKRRAPGRDDPFRVAFTHALQLDLQAKGYPVPGLVGTRHDNNSMVQLNSSIYELFRYVYGSHGTQTAEAATQAGVAQGNLHRLLADHETQFTPPTGSYHAASRIDSDLVQIVESVQRVEPGVKKSALARTCQYLRRAYKDAAARVDHAGFRKLPRTIIHGDWHPGNLLFRDGAIVAVLDFDSARLETRMADIANAGLQFSMEMTTSEDPSRWPDNLDVERIHCLLQGYDEAAAEPVSEAEMQALPWLIIEALIAESVVPIAATGSFARLPGSSFLAMIERKVRWIRPRAKKLTMLKGT